MTSIAVALKAEIARVARKEIRAEIEGLRKASGQHRGSIAQLKREVAELQKALKTARKGLRAPVSAPRISREPNQTQSSIVDDGKARRFSATRLAAHRAKLELSAADYGRLVGMSGATIYLWEQGRARPKPGQVQALGLLKKLSRTKARSRLGSLA